MPEITEGAIRNPDNLATGNTGRRQTKQKHNVALHKHTQIT